MTKNSRTIILIVSILVILNGCLIYYLYGMYITEKKESLEMEKDLYTALEALYKYDDIIKDKNTNIETLESRPCESSSSIKY